ncbi:ABC transporter substrate-binding protein [Halobium salinum]|uniref:ABC transporter substrate-binding protein n=1 Tax=Halobium salinum TaxID=1364940 RepID=A0ABD5PIP1_9EURY|nr:ABC transporter substrate-binding protein [Halobium salinum]
MVDNDTEENRNHCRSRSGRRAFLAAAGAAGVTGLSGCLGSIGGGGGGNTVTYGLLNPMSGAYSSLGPNQRRGAELAVEHINDSDAFDTQVETVTGDTQTDSTAAVQEAERLVNRNGATYLFGAISSSVALALNEFAAEQEIVYNPGGAAVPITGEACNEFVFRTETNTAQIAEAVSAYTANNLGTRVWFHIADYAYGESVLNRVRSRMQDANGNVEVVGTSRSQLGASNYDSFISEIANSDAEVAVLGMTGGDLINFVSQADGQGLKDQVNIMSPTMTFQTVRGALGDAAVGTYGGVRYLPKLTTGDNQQFVEAYRSQHDEDPDNFARVGYESLRMTVRGVDAAGSAEPTDVVEQLPGMEMDTIFGPNRFRDCDHQATNPTWMGEVVEGNGNLPGVETLQKVEGTDALPPCSELGCDLG